MASISEGRWPPNGDSSFQRAVVISRRLSKAVVTLLDKTGHFFIPLLLTFPKVKKLPSSAFAGRPEQIVAAKQNPKQNPLLHYRSYCGKSVPV